MNEKPFPLEHVHALLADRALAGADPAQQAGIDCLLKHHPKLDAEAYDRIAATLQLALESQPEESPPPALLARLQAQGAAFVKQQDNPRIVEPVQAPPSRPQAPASRSNVALAWTGWMVAACVLLFAFVSAEQPNPAIAYRELQSAGAQEYAGKAGPGTDKPVTGEVLWDEKSQTGYMKLRGIAVNDPARSQYQLWIFDKKPFSKDNPTDGGVFNVTSSQEVIIPIKANLKVVQPTLFAITVEQPGGVMVSKREQIVFVASAGP